MKRSPSPCPPCVLFIHSTHMALWGDPRTQGLEGCTRPEGKAAEWRWRWPWGCNSGTISCESYQRHHRLGALLQDVHSHHGCSCHFCKNHTKAVLWLPLPPSQTLPCGQLLTASVSPADSLSRPHHTELSPKYRAQTTTDTFLNISTTAPPTTHFDEDTRCHRRGDE